MPAKRSRGAGSSSDDLPPKRVKAPPKALATRRRKQNYKASYKLAKPFKQVLDKYLNSKQERHWVTLDIDKFWAPSKPLRGPPNDPVGLYNIIPPCTQAGIEVVGPGVTTPMSTNIESRSGQKSRMRSLRISLTLRLNPTYLGYETAPSHPEDATGLRYKVYVFSSKTESEYADFIKTFFGSGTNGTQNEFLKAGNTAEPWDANMCHIDRPVNTNLFTVHASASGMLTKGELVGAAADGYTTAPSAVRNLVLNVRCKNKILRYNSTNAVLPTNFQPSVAIFWKALNGYDYIVHQPHVPNFLQVVGNIRMSFDDLD